jgi:hypothetical protein
MLVDGHLPGEEFLHGQRVALAGFLEAQEAAAHGRDHFGLAPDDPALGVGGWQIGDRERTSIGSDHVFYAGADMLSHGELVRTTMSRLSFYRVRLKIRLSQSIEIP